MKINRNNYETYFMDLMDGKLSPDLQDELRSFLLLNPDLAAELEDVKMVMSDFSEIPNETYPDKASLIQAELPISDEALTELLVKEVEGTITSSDREFLKQLQSNFPFIAKSRLAFAKTRLPLDHIHFDGKESIRFEHELDMSDDMNLLIAFLEGDLSDVQKSALNHRLQSDNELQKKLVQLRLTYLKDSPVIFDHSSLKIEDNVDLSQPAHLLIAKLEGHLSPQELSFVDDQLKIHSSWSEEFRWFQKTKLQPATVLFDEKASLKKRETVVLSLHRARLMKYAAAAAIVAGAIFLTQFFQTGSVATLASQFEHHGYTISEVPAITKGSEKSIDPVESTSNPYATKEYQSEVKNVAMATTQPEVTDTMMSRPEMPKRIPSIPATDLAVSDRSSLQTAVAYVPLTVQTTANKRAFNAPESESLLSYLGKVAGAKLESTSVYALAERQVNKITTQTTEEVQIGRQVGETGEKFRLRIGSFAVETDARKRKQTPDGFLSRVNRVYRNISGE